MHRHCDVTRVLTMSCGQLFAALGGFDLGVEVLVDGMVKG